MKNLILITLLVVTGITTAQSNFEKGMTTAFDLWQADKMDEAEKIFEDLTKDEPEEWLPNYYVAQINSIKSWGTRDVTILKVQLEKAQAHLDLAMKKSENNPELLVMQAQIYTNWVAFDGMAYGMKYSGKVTQLYEQAHQLAPENPRVMFCKAEWGMGSASFFGQDTAPYCKEMEASLELFTNFMPETEFHPNWGKERAVQSIASCKV